MTKKKLCKIFKDNNLRIAVEANKKVTDFLDITLDLHTGSYKPYKKPNDTISYIHCQSNHPPSIIKNLPKGIEIRLSNNSANADIFQEAAKPYNNVLKNNGHKEELKYTNKGTIQNKRGETPNDSDPKKSEALINNTKENNNNNKRKRKITWFNPPFSRNVATNIGKKFFTLLSACFPANNKLHKIINKNTIKLSYSCMGNIKQSIANHNKAILSKEKIKEEQIKLCNCRNRTLCPLQGNCLQKGVVYQATVTQTNTMREDIYIGITENEFKTRYNQHTSSFRLSHKSSSTSLSEHIWKLKENNTDHTVTWKILEKAQPYTPITGKCGLCTSEKAYIAYNHPSLNKRRELFSTCPHRRKHLLLNLKKISEEQCSDGNAPSRSAPSGSAQRPPDEA